MNELNNQGIFLLDVFMLDYCGIKVFFQVCKTTEKSVFLVELATKRYKNGIMLTKNLSVSKKPYIIINNNTRTRSTYEVYPINMDMENREYWLPIEIKINSRIYKEARKEYSPIGIAYAVPIRDFLNKYWLEDEEIEKIEEISQA